MSADPSTYPRCDEVHFGLPCAGHCPCWPAYWCSDLANHWPATLERVTYEVQPDWTLKRDDESAR